MKKLSCGTGEGVDGQVTGDDDGYGIKDGTVDVASGREDDVVEFVFLAVAEAELAVDIFDHDDGAVDDDAEVDGADGEQVGGLAGGVEKDEGEEESERNGERSNYSGTDADEKKDKNDKNKRHAAQKIPFDGVGGDAYEIAAIIKWADFDIGGEKIAVQLDSFLLDALEDILRLLATAHEDDAFDGVGVVFPFVLEAENAEARGVADDHAANVFDAEGHAVAAAEQDFADIFGRLDEAETSDVVKLAALGIETAASVGVVSGEGVENLDDGKVIVVKLNGVEQGVILHGGSAEAGVVSDAGDAAIGPVDDPGLDCVKFRWRAIGTFDDVAVDEAAGTE